MTVSKRKIDKAGKILSSQKWNSDEEYIQMDDIFNEYRIKHLKPLSEVTMKLQEWLSSFSEDYYIAQRLKRRPQMLRKLKRFSVRLTQLQDIGGCRIIVKNNNKVDELLKHIKNKLVKSKYFKLIKIVDYREKGRDESGYRSVHLIIEREKCTLEIQLRSQLQHFWAESIERTSIIYGCHLKELEGDLSVISYFKAESNVLYEIECGRKPTDSQIKDLDRQRLLAEKIILEKNNYKLLVKGINHKFMTGMIMKESRLKGKIHNWLLVFNWKSGEFVEWSVVERNPIKANERYKEKEKLYGNVEGTSNYEVVLIGSSNAATIRHTHSHYFGIEKYDSILQKIDESLLTFEKRNEIDETSRIVISSLYKKEYWGVKKAEINTLKKRYCSNVKNLDDILEKLFSEGYILLNSKKGYVSLNIKMKQRIERIV